MITFGEYFVNRVSYVSSIFVHEGQYQRRWQTKGLFIVFLSNLLLSSKCKYETRIQK